MTREEDSVPGTPEGQAARATRRYLDLLKGALLDTHYLENELRIEYLLLVRDSAGDPGGPGQAREPGTLHVPRAAPAAAETDSGELPRTRAKAPRPPPTGSRTRAWDAIASIISRLCLDPRSATKSIAGHSGQRHRPGGCSDLHAGLSGGP